MAETTTHRPDDKPPDHERVMIVVNNRDVEMPSRDATGAQIKHQANVPAEFILYREQGSKLDPVADDETIRLHDNERFRAVSGQDVS
jgi:hypothetical protein